MKTILLTLSILCVTISTAQIKKIVKKVQLDKTTLQEVKGVLNKVDGNQIALETGSRGTYVVDLNYMRFHDRSSLHMINSIVKVDGAVDATANCRITLVYGSFIVCKQYKGPANPNVYVTKNVQECIVGRLNIFKKLPKDVKISIYNDSGKKVVSGFRDDLEHEIFDIAKYDIYIDGQGLKYQDIVFVNKK